MPPHPVDEARSLLLQQLDERSRPVLESKLRIIRVAREKQTVAAVKKIEQEHAARRMLQSGATIQRCWEAALTEAERAATEIIEACFDLSVPDDDHIAAFAAEDLTQFLKSFMMSRFGHGHPAGARAVANYAALATGRGARVRDEVRSRRFDRDARARNNAVERSRPAAREKQQKFGILDAPQLLAVDLAEPAGILGRVLIYLDLDGFKSVNTRFTERVVDRSILPAFHRLVDRATLHLGNAYAEGGDEVIIYLPNATLEMGVAFAQVMGTWRECRRHWGGPRLLISSPR